MSFQIQSSKKKIKKENGKTENITSINHLVAIVDLWTQNGLETRNLLTVNMVQVRGGPPLSAFELG